MDTKIKEIRELRRMQEELAAELDALVDEVKRYMDAEGVDAISGTDWKVTYKAVTSARFDSTAFKKAMPDLGRGVHENNHKQKILHYMNKEVREWKTTIYC